MRAITELRRVEGGQADQPLGGADARAVSGAPIIPRFWLQLGVIIGLGALLRIFHLGHQSFWLDEAVMFQEAMQPTLRQVLGPVAYPEPELYVGLLHFWAALGHSDTSLRLFSALFGIATIPLFYALFAGMFGRRVGMIAALVLALSPFHVWYSQEARMYALLLFLFTLSTLAFWKALEVPERRRYWIIYGTATALAGLTHAVAVFVVLAQVLFCVIHVRKRTVLTRLIATYAVVGLVLLPVALANIRGLAHSPIAQADKRVSFLTVGYVFFAQSVGFSYGPSIYDLQADTSIAAVRPYWGAVVPAIAIFALSFALGVAAVARAYDCRRQLWLLSLLLILPVGVPVLVDAMGSMTANPRHVVASLIPFLGFIAVGIGSSRRLGFVLAFLVLLVSGVSLANYYWNDRYAKEDARSAAAYLSSVARADTPILVVAYQEPIQRYLGNFRVYGRRDIGPAQSATMEATLQRLMGASPELFLVDLRAWHWDPERRIESASNRLFHRSGERAFHGVRVIHYERKGR